MKCSSPLYQYSRILLAFCLISILLGLTLFFPPPPLARAATLTVQSSADGSASPGNCPGSGCRLRDAIAAAHPAGGDTIDFSLTYPSTITLTSGELDITKSLTINGPGAISLTISGGNTTRVISVTSGIDLSLSGLTIANGNTSDNGGGVFNSGTLNITNTTFYGNSANSYGGGMYNYFGTVNISASNIISNSAFLGGGILNLWDANITNSVVYSNSAASGGGIYNNDVMAITGSFVYNNTTTVFGGRHLQFWIAYPVEQQRS